MIAGDSEGTSEIESNSISLIVTSPPFLDVVDYATDNWLRCWFLGVDPKSVPISIHKKIQDWEAKMERVFCELKRGLQPHGHIAFEVGEIKGGKVRLEESVVRAASRAGLDPLAIMINAQEFTKTANCWGVVNNAKGTNTNRIVILQG